MNPAGLVAAVASQRTRAAADMPDRPACPEGSAVRHCGGNGARTRAECGHRSTRYAPAA